MVTFISDAGEFYLEQIEKNVQANSKREVEAKVLYDMAAEIRRLNRIALTQQTEISRLNIKVSKLEEKSNNEVMKLHSVIGKLNLANQISNASKAYETIKVYKG